MRTHARWTERTAENNGVRPPVTDLCFSPNGDQMVTAAGNRVFIYMASNGTLVHSLKGHKDTIYCCAYSCDGKRFASGGADRTVIIWNSRGEGLLKYQHQESIQGLSFNPVTNDLISVSSSDFGIWFLEHKSVSKHRLSDRGTCCAWSPDGMFIAIGMYNGKTTIRSGTNPGEEVCTINRIAPIWTMAFNPVKQNPEGVDGQSILAIGSWDKRLSFYAIPSGKKIYGGKDRELPCDPCSVSFFTTGEFILIGGSDRKAGLYTKDGIFLVTVAETQDWVWAVKQRPKQYFVGTCSNDGAIAGIELNITTVHSIYQDYYVFRENLTDVVIQHLSTDRRLKIPCYHYVKKVAIYRDRVAVQLLDKIIIYDIVTDENNEMKHKEKERILKKLDCSLLCVTATHLILCQDKRLTLCDFMGNKRREWAMDSVIRYIKVVGGLASREALLLGLKNGLVAKIFVDNSFPTVLVKISVPIRCVDLSASRNKLAVVDEQNILHVYALGPNSTSELLFQENNATAVAWNSDYEDMLCYSGGETLFIKTSDLPPYQQKLQGFVVGIKGNKVFTLHSATMHTIDVPHSHSMYRYLERKEFDAAYRIACLGVTDGDWKMLGMHAMSHLNLEIARKAFVRIKEVKLVELLNRIELERRSSNMNSGDVSLVQGDILAFQGKYSKAAACFIRSNQEYKAIEMYADLKMWSEALKICDTNEHRDLLTRRQAEWAETMGDHREAAKLALSAGDTKRAIKLLGQEGEVEKLKELCHSLTKADGDLISECARYFRQYNAITYSLEAYERIGDIKGMLQLHVEQGMWQDAFRLLHRYPHYNEDVYVPWAMWLATHDRFDEAQDAFKKAGKPKEALYILEQLAGNSTTTRKFNDAGYYFMKLAGECGAMSEMSPKSDSRGGSIKEEDTCSSNTNTKSKNEIKGALMDGKELNKKIEAYNDLVRRGDIYYAYNIIYRYMYQPFTSSEPNTIFNASSYLLAMLTSSKDGGGAKDDVPYNVSKIDIIMALGRLTSSLDLNRMSRAVYEKLQQFVLPPRVQEEVDIAALAIRGRPFTDKEEYLTTCYRCNQILPGLVGPGDRCPNCFHPFVRSFVSFDPLPLVDFVLSNDLSDEEAEKIILSGVGKKPKSLNDWTKHSDGGNMQNPEVITFNDDIVDVALNAQAMAGIDTRDPFARQLVQIELNGRSSNGKYVPIVCDAAMLKAFPSEEIFICKRGQHATGIPIGNKYYRLMIPSVGITLCQKCQHFFHDEEYEFEIIKGNGCPLCRYKPMSQGNKDLIYV